MNNLDCDVLVIGAGLAGLSTCYTLINSNNNLKIILIEGRDRCGGRTETITTNYGNVDVGGQWIGPQHTFMLNYINKFGLLLKEQKYTAITNNSQHNRLIEFYNANIISLTNDESNEIESFMEYIDKLCKEIDIFCPWSLPEAIKLDSITMYEYINNNIQSTNVRIEISLYLQTILAINTSSCSLLGFVYYIASGGGLLALGDGEQGAQKWTIEGGSQQVSIRLAGELINKGIKLQYNTTALSISHNDSVDHKLITKCDSNDQKYTITSKFVVIAMCPRLALDNINIHTNILSQEKRLIYENMTPGKCVKLILIYDEAFWNNNNKLINLLDIKDFVIHNIFISHVSNCPALVCLITGDAVDKYLSYSIEDRKQVVFNQIYKMYDCTNDKYNHPLEYIEKNWCDERYSGGCYDSIIKPGYLSMYGEYLQTSKSNIHWSSCEMSSEYYGYMEGAVRSGCNTANQIIKTYNN